MDDRIGRLVAMVGVDQTAAGNAVSVAQQIPIKEGPKAHVEARHTRMSGAGFMMRPPFSPSDAGGTFGGAVAAGARLVAASLGIRQIQPVIREATGFAPEKAGADAVGISAGAVPGLARFV